MDRPFRLILLAAAPMLAGGCAAAENARFPSLGMRPAERVTGTAEPAPSPPRPEIVPPATGDRLSGLRQQALAADRAFQQRRGTAVARVAAARGAAVASENWAVAQVALADLEAARSAAMIALADLDTLYVDAALAAAGTGGSAELDAVAAAREEVTARIAGEDAALAALRGQVRD
ncbi:MAG: hypothetical protein ABW203_06535 [Novosphingobium sp.]